MFNPQDPEAYETCPYNSAHRILKYRMGVHLARCRKVYHEQSTMAVCVFNSNHRVAEIELQYHLQNCPDKYNLDKHVYITDDIDHQKFPVQVAEVQNEENWDEENVPSYQPEVSCEKKPVLRQTKIESAATRKNFRVEERHRIQNLKAMEPSNIENINQEIKEPTKFRGTALANTTTNVNEQSPYSLEDLQHIIESREPKPIITDPNYAASSSKTKGETTSSENGESIRSSNNDHSSSSSLSHISDKEKMDTNGFVMQKQKRRPGKGRGRGYNR